MRTLLIGGTRNLGRETASVLLARGHSVTVANRGATADDLGELVERIRVDRNAGDSLARAFANRSYDAIIDFTTYTGLQARDAVNAFGATDSRYVFVSTGQVYLVLEDEPEMPAREEDYDGALARVPDDLSLRDGWQYGVDKRDAEQVITESALRSTILRLPMVNGKLDHFERLANYVARLRDGAPIVAPSSGNRPIRHVLADDVARIMVDMLEQGLGEGKVYNLSHDETMSLEEFLAVAADAIGRRAEIAYVDREIIESRGLLPAASPFSGRYMSVIANDRARKELGARFTPAPEAFAALARYFAAGQDPSGYAQRPAELLLLGSR